MPVTKDQMFKDVGWVSTRIMGAWVVNKETGRLVRVVDRLGATMFFCVDENNDEFRLTLKKLDLVPPPLGMIDFSTGGGYVTRLPKRNDWRQGIRRSNLRFTRLGETDGGRDVEFIPSLNQAIQNQYLSVQDAVTLVQDKFQVRAISREFSLDDRGRLIYKNNLNVGGINKEENGFNLHPKFHFLQEALNEVVNPTEQGVVEDVT